MALSPLRRRLTLGIMLAVSLSLALSTVVFIPTGAHVRATTQETVTAPFVNGPNGVTTVNSYAGNIAITVSGIGQAAGPRYSDAFYVFTDDAGNLIPPEHHWDFGLCINKQPAENYVAVPPYNSNHIYQFTISLSGSPQPITFGVCDQYTADNSGSYSITVTGASAQPQTSLSVQKIASLSRAEPGETLGYSIIVTNQGPANARNIVVSDPLPQQISAITLLAISQGTCSVSGHLLKCPLGNLASGSQAVINVFATVNPTATLGDSLPNSATVSADNAVSKTSNTVLTRVVSPLTLDDIVNFLHLVEGTKCLAAIASEGPVALLTPPCLSTLYEGGVQFVALAQCLGTYHRLDVCTGFGKNS